MKDIDIHDHIKDDGNARLVEDIAYCEIDDDYDEQQFIVRNSLLRWRQKVIRRLEESHQSIASTIIKKKAETTQRLSLNEEVSEILYDFRSSAIECKTGRKICVRFISQFGYEALKVLSIK